MLTLSVLKNPCVRCRTPAGMVGTLAERARCGEDCGESPEPPQSLQLSSDADLLRCFRSDEHLDSRFSRERSTELRIA